MTTAHEDQFTPAPVEVTQAELQKLQKLAGLDHLPTQFTYQLRMAVSGAGPRAYDWSDKPHRLLYDACQEIERIAHSAPAGEVMDPDDIVTMAKELASDPSNTLYGNMVLGVMCATIIDLRADLAKARLAHPAPPADLVEVLKWYAEQFCELGVSHDCCGRLPSGECSGCMARAALAKHGAA